MGKLKFCLQIIEVSQKLSKNVSNIIDLYHNKKKRRGVNLSPGPGVNVESTSWVEIAKIQIKSRLYCIDIYDDDDCIMLNASEGSERKTTLQDKK